MCVTVKIQQNREGQMNADESVFSGDAFPEETIKTRRRRRRKKPGKPFSEFSSLE